MPFRYGNTNGDIALAHVNSELATDDDDVTDAELIADIADINRALLWLGGDVIATIRDTEPLLDPDNSENT